MKMIKALTGIAALTMAVPALAALPPGYQRAAELKAILNHEKLVEAFPFREFIQRVEYVRQDLYRVSTESCTLYAKIVGKPLPPGMVGARQFDVVLGKAECAAE